MKSYRQKPEPLKQSHFRGNVSFNIRLAAQWLALCTVWKDLSRRSLLIWAAAVFSGALLPHAQRANAGRGRQSFPTTDRHPRCLLLPPAVSHGSRDTALGAGEIHKPPQRDIMDRMEGMPFFLRITEGNFARVMDQEVLGVWGQESTLRMGYRKGILDLDDKI